MSGLFIVADLSALGQSARIMGAAAGTDAQHPPLPVVGHPAAEAALHDFAAAMQRQASHLAAVAAEGANALSGYAVGFQEAGGR